MIYLSIKELKSPFICFSLILVRNKKTDRARLTQINCVYLMESVRSAQSFFLIPSFQSTELFTVRAREPWLIRRIESKRDRNKKQC